MKTVCMLVCMCTHKTQTSPTWHVTGLGRRGRRVGIGVGCLWGKWGRGRGRGRWEGLRQDQVS